MCLCILAYRQLHDHPVVMAANREELYARLADPPAWIATQPPVFAGRDRTAGGTWQGINQHGVLVALTNRRAGQVVADRRSRGLLCLDALRRHSAAEAAAWLVAHLGTQAYNPCNLLCVDAGHALAVHHDGKATDCQELGPGWHFLADTEVNDFSHPRIRHARGLLAPDRYGAWPEWRPRLAAVMADHAVGRSRSAAICRHGETGGTVSSALIALRSGGLGQDEFWLAAGAPCTEPYVDLSARLIQPSSSQIPDSICGFARSRNAKGAGNPDKPLG